MISISLCMIVKNEEKQLERCLRSLKGVPDELIIVDTGSTDKTKEIASRYTAHVYDFAWVDDFAAARNFAFSKATKDYIYSADADEVLDETNRARFLQLKETLLPEIELVQMYYCNQLKFGTVYNFDKEYRPKLFKRSRSFAWMDPIHETIRTEPVVFDSDIEIIHEPEESHGGRDLAAFGRILKNGERLSERLHTMYARELFIAGSEEDFLQAADFFMESCASPECGPSEIKEAACVAARAARLRGDMICFFKYAMKVVSMEGCSEICFELGSFYLDAEDYEEAGVWFYNAAYETESILDIRTSRELPLRGLAKCCRHNGLAEEEREYERLAKEACKA